MPLSLSANALGDVQIQTNKHWQGRCGVVAGVARVAESIRTFVGLESNTQSECSVKIQK